MTPAPPDAGLRLRFFVESREEAQRAGSGSRARFLARRVFNDALLRRLAARRAGLVLACRAEEDGIDALVQAANAHGVEVDLWLNLPRELGYWQSRHNVHHALGAAERLLSWIERRELGVRCIGVDVEPSIALVGAYANRRLLPLLRELAAVQRSPRGATDFARLIELINARHGVELYKLPVWGDLGPLRRLLGLYAPPAGFSDDARNRVVSMLYSSIAPRPLRRFFVGGLLRAGEVPAVGIVSANDEDPGVTLPFTAPGRRPALLDQVQLERDLRQTLRAARPRGAPPEIYVFALNGAPVLDRLEGGLQRLAGA